MNLIIFIIYRHEMCVNIIDFDCMVMCEYSNCRFQNDSKIDVINHLDIQYSDLIVIYMYLPAGRT